MRAREDRSSPRTETAGVSDAVLRGAEILSSDPNAHHLPLHRPQARELEISLLRGFESAFPPPPNHLLRRFTDTLIDASENTRKAYTADVWSFLAVKFFNFWDFRRQYNPAAQGLAIMHALDLAGRRLLAGSITPRQGEQLLSSAVRSAAGFFPAGGNLKPALPREVSALLGGSFSISSAAGRLQMSLRGAPPEAEVVQIRRQDRMMLALLMGHFETLLDGGFWGDVFRRDKIGEVLSFQERRGSSKNTIARKMAALERFEEFLSEQGRLAARALPAMRRPKIQRAVQLSLSGRDLERLFARLNQACAGRVEKDPLLALRDRAMLGLFDLTLVRANALCSAKLQDLNLGEKEWCVREKGRKQALLPLEGRALEYLREFLKVRPQFLDRFRVPERWRDHLFHTVRGLPMNGRSVSRIVNEWAQAAGIRKSVNGRTCVGAHALRRSAAIEMSDNGARIEELSDLMNHSSITTTQIYLRHGRRNLRETVVKHHPRGK